MKIRNHTNQLFTDYRVQMFNSTLLSNDQLLSKNDKLQNSPYLKDILYSHKVRCEKMNLLVDKIHNRTMDDINIISDFSYLVSLNLGSEKFNCEIFVSDNSSFLDYTLHKFIKIVKDKNATNPVDIFDILSTLYYGENPYNKNIIKGVVYQHNSNSSCGFSTGIMKDEIDYNDYIKKVGNLKCGLCFTDKLSSIRCSNVNDDYCLCQECFTNTSIHSNRQKCPFTNVEYGLLNHYPHLFNKDLYYESEKYDILFDKYEIHKEMRMKIVFQVRSRFIANSRGTATGPRSAKFYTDFLDDIVGKTIYKNSPLSRLYNDIDFKYMKKHRATFFGKYNNLNEFSLKILEIKNNKASNYNYVNYETYYRNILHKRIINEMAWKLIYFIGRENYRRSKYSVFRQGYNVNSIGYVLCDDEYRFTRLYYFKLFTIYKGLYGENGMKSIMTSILDSKITMNMISYKIDSEKYKNYKKILDNTNNFRKTKFVANQMSIFKRWSISHNKNYWEAFVNNNSANFCHFNINNSPLDLKYGMYYDIDEKKIYKMRFQQTNLNENSLNDIRWKIFNNTWYYNPCGRKFSAIEGYYTQDLDYCEYFTQKIDRNEYLYLETLKNLPFYTGPQYEICNGRDIYYPPEKLEQDHHSFTYEKLQTFKFKKKFKKQKCQKVLPQ